MKLHLGCGNNKLAGYVNIDSVAAFQPDVVHDISEPLPYPDLSVEEVLVEGVLEHFDKYLRYLVVYDWARVLAVGGVLNVSVPDFPKILSKYRKLGFDNFVDTIFGENMLQAETYVGHFGSHKFAYSQESLAAFVRQFGIEPVAIKHNGFSLTLIGEKKRHLDWDRLSGIVVYAHANSFGDKPYLSLGAIKSKIKAFREVRKSSPD